MSNQKKNNFRQLTAAALALLICAGYAPAVADVTGISFAVPASAEQYANGDEDPGSSTPAYSVGTRDDCPAKVYAGVTGTTLTYSADNNADSDTMALTSLDFKPRITMSADPASGNAYFFKDSDNDWHEVTGKNYYFTARLKADNVLTALNQNGEEKGIYTTDVSYTVVQAPDTLNPDVGADQDTLNSTAGVTATVTLKIDVNNIQYTNSGAVELEVVNGKITAGTFTSVPAHDLLADGTKVVDGTESGTYKVVPDVTVAFGTNQWTDENKKILAGKKVDKKAYLTVKKGTTEVPAEDVTITYYKGKFNDGVTATEGASYTTSNGLSETPTELTSPDYASVGNCVFAKATITGTDGESDFIYLGTAQAVEFAPAFITGQDEKPLFTVLQGTAIVGTSTPATTAVKVVEVDGDGTDIISKFGVNTGTKFYEQDSSGTDYREINDTTRNFEADKDYYVKVTVAPKPDDAVQNVYGKTGKDFYLKVTVTDSVSAVDDVTPTVTTTPLTFNGTAQVVVTEEAADGVTATGTRVYCVTTSDTAPEKTTAKNGLSSNDVPSNYSPAIGGEVKAPAYAGTYHIWSYVRKDSGENVVDSPIEDLGPITIDPAEFATGTKVSRDQDVTITIADTVPALTASTSGLSALVGSKTYATLTVNGYSSTGETTTIPDLSSYGKVEYAFYTVETTGGKDVYTVVDPGTQFEQGKAYAIGATFTAGATSDYKTQTIYTSNFTPTTVEIANADVSQIKAQEGLKYTGSGLVLLTGTEGAATPEGSVVKYAAVEVKAGKEATAPAVTATDTWYTLSELKATGVGTYQIFYYVEAPASASKTTASSAPAKLNDVTVTINKGDLPVTKNPKIVDCTAGYNYILVDGKELASGEGLIDQDTDDLGVVAGKAGDFYFCTTAVDVTTAPEFDGDTVSDNPVWTKDNTTVKTDGKYNVWCYVQATDEDFNDKPAFLLGTAEVKVNQSKPTVTGDLTYKSEDLYYSTAKYELLSKTDQTVPEGCTLKFYTVKREEGASAAPVPIDATKLEAFKANFKSRTEDADVTSATELGTYDVYWYVAGDGVYYTDSGVTLLSGGKEIAKGAPTVTLSYSGSNFKVGDALPVAADFADPAKWSVGVKFGSESVDVDLGTPTVTVTKDGAAVTAVKFADTGDYKVKVTYPATDNWNEATSTEATIKVVKATAVAASTETKPQIIETELTYALTSKDVATPQAIVSPGTVAKTEDAEIKYFISTKSEDTDALNKSKYTDAGTSNVNLKKADAGTYHIWYFVQSKSDDYTDGEITYLGEKTIAKAQATFELPTPEPIDGNTAVKEALATLKPTAKIGDVEVDIPKDAKINFTVYTDKECKNEFTDAKFPVTAEETKYYVKASVPESETYKAGETAAVELTVKAEAIGDIEIKDADGKTATAEPIKYVTKKTIQVALTATVTNTKGKPALDGHKLEWYATSTKTGITVADYISVKDGVVTILKADATANLTFNVYAKEGEVISNAYELKVARDADSGKTALPLSLKVEDTKKGEAPKTTIKCNTETITEGKGVDVDGVNGSTAADIEVVYYSDPSCAEESIVKDITKADAGKYYAQVHGFNITGTTSGTTYRETYSDVTSFTIKPIVEKITIVCENPSPDVGDVLFLTATVEPDTVDEKDKAVTWSSSDDTYATVDKNGKVNLLKAGKVTITATSTADATVKGTCELTVGAEKFAVTFAAGTGATLPEGTAKVMKLSALPNPLPIPTKDGYDFDAWYTDPEFTTKAVAGADVTEPVVLYANWIPQSTTEFTVKFDSNGGSAVDSQTVREGAKVKEPTAPTRTGYDFVEWQLDGAKYDFSSPVKGNLTLKAAWKLQTNTVTYMLGSTTLGTEEVAYGKKPVKAAKDYAEVAGKKITGWYEDEACTKFFSGSITEAKTLYAKAITDETAVGTIDGKPVDQMSNDDIVKGIGTATEGVDITLANDLDAGKGLTGPKKGGDSASIKINGDGNKINFSGNAKITANKSQSLDIENAEIGTTKSTTITGAAGGTTLENVTIDGKKATINSKTGDLTIGRITDKTEKGITVKGNKAKNATVDGDVKVASIGTYNTITVDAAELTVTKSLKASTLNLDGGTLILNDKASATVDNLTGVGTIVINSGSKGFTVKKSLSGAVITLEGTGFTDKKCKIKVPKTMSDTELNEMFDATGYELHNNKGTVVFVAVS